MYLLLMRLYRNPGTHSDFGRPCNANGLGAGSAATLTGVYAKAIANIAGVGKSQAA